MRNLDAKIQEALGYEVKYASLAELLGIYNLFSIKDWSYNAGHTWYTVPSYSIDGNAMLELNEEMRKLGYIMLVDEDDGLYIVEYVRYVETECHAVSYSKAITMPEAVAKAAYYVLTGLEWKE